VTDSTVHLEVANRIAVVTIDRPPVNALSKQALQDLTDTMWEVSDRTEDVSVAILTGAGRTFCAGRDLKEAINDPHEKRNRMVRNAFASVMHCQVPIIAAINGPAIGGGASIALYCDMLLASKNAYIRLPEINHGLAGGFVALRRGMNQYQARKLYLFGEPMYAEEAHRIGMIDTVVESDELMPLAMRYATKLAEKPAAALRAAKWSSKEVEKIPDMEQAYRAIQSRTSAGLVTSKDHAEAVKAFSEKREPVFNQD
jgi:enoyl-CoA hydratase